MSTGATDVDSLWAEIDRLLPEGQVLEELTRWFASDGGGYAATVWEQSKDKPGRRGYGATPEAALRDLLAQLRP